MKQKIYLYGLVTMLVIFTGIIFKMNHWPGAGIMLTAGFAALVVIFLPSALISNYKASEPRQNLLLYIVTYITCFVVFTGMLFKIQHWPYAGLFIMIAIPFPFVVFLPVFMGVTSRIRNFNIYNVVYVLFLLALVSVFSALLALNVSKTTIDDSYNLSQNYNNLKTALKTIPGPGPQDKVSTMIDEALKTISDYKEVILKSEGISLESWNSEPGNLLLPDRPAVAAQALLKHGETPPGSKLESQLKGLIAEMEKTAGYEKTAGAARDIFDFRDTSPDEDSWTSRTFTFNNLAWVLIYLDGLEAKLYLIKAGAR